MNFPARTYDDWSRTAHQEPKRSGLSRYVERSHSPHRMRRQISLPKAYGKRASHIAEIRAMENLESSWAGECSSVPSKTAISAAIAFVNALSEDALDFRVGLSNDGEIGLFYEAGGLYVDIGFDDMGLASYYGNNGEGEIFGDGPFEETIPKELLSFIASN